MPTCSLSRTRLTDHREAIPFSIIVDVGLCRGVDVQFTPKPCRPVSSKQQSHALIRHDRSVNFKIAVPHDHRPGSRSGNGSHPLRSPLRPREILPAGLCGVLKYGRYVVEVVEPPGGDADNQVIGLVVGQGQPAAAKAAERDDSGEREPPVAVDECVNRRSAWVGRLEFA
jgi:hypothetical protein